MSVVRFYHSVIFFFFFFSLVFSRLWETWRTNKWQLSNYSKVAGNWFLSETDRDGNLCEMCGLKPHVGDAEGCCIEQLVCHQNEVAESNLCEFLRPRGRHYCFEVAHSYTENICQHLSFVFLLKFHWNFTVAFLLNVCIQYDPFIFSHSHSFLCCSLVL